MESAATATPLNHLSAPREGGGLPLDFQEPTPGHLAAAAAIYGRWRPSQACDFTPGIFAMWNGYFRRRVCVDSNTLFMLGVAEDNRSLPAFTVPVGALPLECSLDRLRRYCQATDTELRLTSVPASEVERIRAVEPGCRVEQMHGWSDYIYSLDTLATLTGKKMNKKRNHVNRFDADNPGWRLDPLDQDNARDVLHFFDSLDADPGLNAMGRHEQDMIRRLLRRPGEWGMMEGAVLSTPRHGIVAFTLGEAAGDTLVTHVEKMNHQVPGAGETVAHAYARMMALRHPALKWANREEDLGDPGLQYAKASWHPVAMIDKYTVTLDT